MKKKSTKIVKLKYIAIEGPVGVGKTTLAKRLAEDLSAELVLEHFQHNPFLERFYDNQKEVALHTQLFFLLKRMKLLKGMDRRGPHQETQGNQPRIADFLIQKDKIFAECTLNPHELDLYYEIYDEIIRDVIVPDLVVYLQAPVEILKKRIARRGRKYEKSISHAYIQQLVDAYTGFFHYYDEAPLLIVNATEIDVVSVEEDYQELFRQVEITQSGRHYFNPLPHTINA